jgi:hypothetical protein
MVQLNGLCRSREHKSTLKHPRFIYGANIFSLWRKAQSICIPRRFYLPIIDNIRCGLLHQRLHCSLCARTATDVAPSAHESIENRKFVYSREQSAARPRFWCSNFKPMMQ